MMWAAANDEGTGVSFIVVEVLFLLTKRNVLLHVAIKSKQRSMPERDTIQRNMIWRIVMLGRTALMWVFVRCLFKQRANNAQTTDELTQIATAIVSWLSHGHAEGTMEEEEGVGMPLKDPAHSAALALGTWILIY
jgi:hypothetical protein